MGNEIVRQIGNFLRGHGATLNFFCTALHAKRAISATATTPVNVIKVKLKSFRSTLFQGIPRPPLDEHAITTRDTAAGDREERFIRLIRKLSQTVHCRKAVRRISSGKP